MLVEVSFVRSVRVSDEGVHFTAALMYDKHVKVTHVHFASRPVALKGDASETAGSCCLSTLLCEFFYFERINWYTNSEDSWVGTRLWHRCCRTQTFQMDKPCDALFSNNCWIMYHMILGGVLWSRNCVVVLSTATRGAEWFPSPDRKLFCITLNCVCFLSGDLGFSH